MIKPRFIIIVEGGNISGVVHCNGEAMDYVVVDYDVEEGDEHDLVYKIPQVNREGAVNGYEDAWCYTDETAEAEKWAKLVIEGLEE